MGEIIHANGLTKIYHVGYEEIMALNGIDIGIDEQEIVCIMGSSGSGKSTLLSILAGLEPPTRGIINICSEQITNMNENQLAHFRRQNMGVVFQNFNLMPYLTAIENVALPLSIQGVPENVRTQMAANVLRQLNMLLLRH